MNWGWIARICRAALAIDSWARNAYCTIFAAWEVDRGPINLTPIPLVSLGLMLFIHDRCYSLWGITAIGRADLHGPFPAFCPGHYVAISPLFPSSLCYFFAKLWDPEAFLGSAKKSKRSSWSCQILKYWSLQTSFQETIMFCSFEHV